MDVVPGLGGEKRAGPRPQEGPRGSRLAAKVKQTEEEPVGAALGAKQLGDTEGAEGPGEMWPVPECWPRHLAKVERQNGQEGRGRGLGQGLCPFVLGQTLRMSLDCLGETQQRGGSWWEGS